MVHLLITQNKKEDRNMLFSDILPYHTEDVPLARELLHKAVSGLPNFFKEKVPNSNEIFLLDNAWIFNGSLHYIFIVEKRFLKSMFKVTISHQSKKRHKSYCYRHLLLKLVTFIVKLFSVQMFKKSTFFNNKEF